MKTRLLCSARPFRVPPRSPYVTRAFFFLNLLLMLVFCFLRGSMISTKNCGVQHRLALYHQLLSFFFF